MSPRKARRLPGEVPRKPRRAGRAPQGTGRADDEATSRLGPPVTEEWPDGDWVVRQVPSAAAVRMYRCPGCSQEIRPGTAHVVVWPARADGTEYRRHWHNACWRRRPRRALPGYQ